MKYSVNVYKLVHNGLPIWHTGVAFHDQNNEFYFADSNKVCICNVKDFSNRHHREIELVTDKTDEEFWNEFLEIYDAYNKKSYDLLSCNCNTFSNEVMSTIFGRNLDQEYMEHSGVQRILQEIPGMSTVCEIFKSFGGVTKYDKEFERDINKLPGGHGITGTVKKVGRAIKTGKFKL